MKRSSKIIIGSIVGLGLVGAVTAKQFGVCDHGPDQRADWIANRVSDKLDLSESQESELQNLKVTALTAITTIREQRPAYSEIEALFGSEFDQSKAMQLLDSRSQAVKDKAPELITAFANFYNTLDDEQRNEISEMLEKRMKHGSRNGKWAHRGGDSND